jgi:hypothetical protein
MPPAMTQIRCPQCSNPIQARIEQVVDVSQDPASKARLLSGSLNVVRCPVCGFEGQIAAPLVYHDPEKELLLTFVPSQVPLEKDEQERAIGRLINEIIDRLPGERRKGYLLQPQTALTMQGLVERVLEADGITREQIEAQRERVRLFEQMLTMPEEELPDFVQRHDEELDDTFFQLAALSLQTAGDGQARERADKRIQLMLQHSSYGMRLLAKEDALQDIAGKLQQLGEDLGREDLLELALSATDDEHIEALVRLARPAFDYVFFQQLTERMESAEGAEHERMAELRSHLLRLTEEIDQAQEARAMESAALLRSLMESEDLDQAIEEALPYVDELFLGILQANLRAAKEQSDEQAQARLREIDARLRKLIRDSLPPSLQLAQRLLDQADESQAFEILGASADQIDDLLIGALQATAQRLERGGDPEGAGRVRRLLKRAEEMRPADTGQPA